MSVLHGYNTAIDDVEEKHVAEDDVAPQANRVDRRRNVAPLGFRVTENLADEILYDMKWLISQRSELLRL